ncbi:DNA glycosylase [Exidia glandulosa HHB12029]|uniref:DNA glycosylase n=1 Tax=Exidia glandulosa HHB12029 TaxID=1314781 RepID=A0A165C9X5_EXIGL|nr:DNA glycosylase [Exidia glandulosa HHB12029]
MAFDLSSSALRLRTTLAAFECPSTPRRSLRAQRIASHAAQLATPSPSPARTLPTPAASLHVFASSDSLPTPPVSPLKRARLDEQSSSSPRRKPRGYAEPEVYAHLECLTDRLLPNLDIVFCGINPGVESATKGAHYAHPTNLFWRGLSSSGLTSRLVPPCEEAILPVEFSLGLTDMVDRPTSDATELSKADFHAGVPKLLAKLAFYRPRIVCLVGKCIWDRLYETFIGWTRAGTTSTLCMEALERRPVTISPILQPATKKGTKKMARFVYGLQPFRLVHSSIAGDETLIFVMPSTSGRAANPSSAEKLALFKKLKANVAELKAGTVETSSFRKVTFTSESEALVTL